MFRNTIMPSAIRPFVESRRSRLVAGTDKETKHLHIHCPTGARATSVVALRLTWTEKVTFLLLCVAKQYRGAVELCETEGLRKSIWVIITFTPIFRNQFVPQAIPLFVEPQRLEPRASWLYWPERTRKRHLCGLFQPLPLAGLPLSHFVRRGRKGNLLLLCVA